MGKTHLTTLSAIDCIRDIMDPSWGKNTPLVTPLSIDHRDTTLYSLWSYRHEKIELYISIILFMA
jgi:hypothetical protein